MLLPEGASRNDLRATLGRARIQTSVHYPPIHLFSRYTGSSDRPLPQTEAIAPRLVTLPLYGHMSDQQADAVIEAVRASLATILRSLFRSRHLKSTTTLSFAAGRAEKRTASSDRSAG